MIRFMIYGKHGAYLNTGTVNTWKELEEAKQALESNGQKMTITGIESPVNVASRRVALLEVAK